MWRQPSAQVFTQLAPACNSRCGLCRRSGQEQHTGREECLGHGCSLQVWAQSGGWVWSRLPSVAGVQQALPAPDSWHALDLRAMRLRC